MKSSYVTVVSIAIIAMISTSCMAAPGSYSTEVPAKAPYRQGLKLFSEGHYREALGFYDKSVSLDPNCAQTYVDRGAIYFFLHQPDKALKDLTKAISLNPNNVHAYINRGAVYGELHQYQKVIEDCSKAISLNLNPAATASAYANRGEAYVKIGQFQKAVEDLTKAIGTTPQPAEGYYYRSVAYAKLGKKDLANKDRAKAKELGYREGGNTAIIEGR